MTTTARGRIPRLICASCISSALLLSTGATTAIAVTQSPTPVQQIPRDDSGGSDQGSDSGGSGTSDNGGSDTESDTGDQSGNASDTGNQPSDTGDQNAPSDTGSDVGDHPSVPSDTGGTDTGDQSSNGPDTSNQPSDTGDHPSMPSDTGGTDTGDQSSNNSDTGNQPGFGEAIVSSGLAAAVPHNVNVANPAVSPCELEHDPSHLCINPQTGLPSLQHPTLKQCAVVPRLRGCPKAPMPVKAVQPQQTSKKANPQVSLKQGPGGRHRPQGSNSGGLLCAVAPQLMGCPKAKPVQPVKRVQPPPNNGSIDYCKKLCGPQWVLEWVGSWLNPPEKHGVKPPPETTPENPIFR